MPHVPVCAGCVFVCVFIVAANNLLLIKNYVDKKKTSIPIFTCSIATSANIYKCSFVIIILSNVTL